MNCFVNDFITNYLNIELFIRTGLDVIHFRQEITFGVIALFTMHSLIL